MSETKAIEVPSSRFGRYMIRSRLGQGGMAEVFLAESVDERGEQVSVALKLMKKDVPEDTFAAEADLMGLLNHPNLVRLMEVGNAFGRPYIAMEFLIGGDLHEVMDAHSRQMKGFPLGMGVHIVIETLKALAYFHTATTRTGTPLKLVHSDVNPTNVFFSGAGEVKLGDYGVASSTHVDIGPGEGVAAGKLSYLSPEQTRGEPVTPQSDVWAVGAMLHELVVGYHPFRHEGWGEAETMAAIRSPKLTIPEYVDRPLAAVITKALTPDLRQRFRSAGEMAGPLFAYALDRNMIATPKGVQEWLESVLGLLV
jgi:eukaryotic-like serine/threonine-protein kinase